MIFCFFPILWPLRFILWSPGGVLVPVWEPITFTTINYDREIIIDLKIYAFHQQSIPHMFKIHLLAAAELIYRTDCCVSWQGTTLMVPQQNLRVVWQKHYLLDDKITCITIADFIPTETEYASQKILKILQYLQYWIFNMVVYRYMTFYCSL